MNFVQVYDETKLIDETYEYHYQFPFTIDNLQKYGFQQIDKNDNILICAPTGTGKTSYAIYSIFYHLKKNNKIVYTSPVKALSNEKYREMTDLIKTYNNQHNTNYTVGILTGDIKINPLADIIIMTTEILRNALYKKTDKEIEDEFNFTENTGCVIFDECHYIASDRGTVWEESIVLLNPSIQLIMLSATIDNPYDFSQWIGHLKQKPIHLIATTHRNVPLEYYIYMKNNLYSIFNNNQFNLIEYTKAKQIYNLVKEEKEKKHKMHTLNTEILTELVRYLSQNDLLQAIIFSFSKNQCELFAESIIQQLTTEDEIIEIDKVFDMYMSKYPEYHQLSQYINLKSMIRKGIAYHHSGLIQIMKEIVEILFKQGLIKIIFGTETLGIGVNFSVKTVVFTSLQKHTKKEFRYLTTSEYLQMAGRAGRRGKDIKGNVIILPLYLYPSDNDLKYIFTGPKQRITSKFIYDYGFILKIPLSENLNIDTFISKSLFYVDNMKLVNGLNYQLNQLQQKIDSSEFNIDEQILSLIKEYDKFESNRKKLENELGIKVVLSKKQQKEQQSIQFKINKIDNFKEYYQKYNEYNQLNDELSNINKRIIINQNIINDNSKNMIQFLVDIDYMCKTALNKNLNEITKEDITVKGIIASYITECNPIILTEIIVNDLLLELDLIDIIVLLSMLIQDTNNPLQESDDKNGLFFDYTILSENIKSVCKFLREQTSKYIELEQYCGIYDSEKWELITDFINPAKMWAEKKTIQKITQTGIYEGTFVRNMLKISNIVNNIETLCKIHGSIELLPKLVDVNNIIMRDIVSVNSLYI
jgi:superfamily II RNA helicase